MQLAIRRFQAESGERFSILVDNAGMPLYYPALYVTAELHGRSLSINTINNALSALKAMCAWQNYYDLDLESRFKRSELLCRHEIHSLRDFMQKPLEDMCSKEKQVVVLKGRHRRVAKDNQYNRITVIAGYVGFLAGRLHSVTDTSAQEIDVMVAQIKANRSKISDKTDEDRSVFHLDDSVLDTVEEVLKLWAQCHHSGTIRINRDTGQAYGTYLCLKLALTAFIKSQQELWLRRAGCQGGTIP